MAEWEEVRRLATDFQRIQASSTAHRLSERNCVELVSRLLDMGLVEVVHTLDGKEYVTPQYLEREIREELTAHRGKREEVKGGDYTFRTFTASSSFPGSYPAFCPKKSGERSWSCAQTTPRKRN